MEDDMSRPAARSIYHFALHGERVSAFASAACCPVTGLARRAMSGRHLDRE